MNAAEIIQQARGLGATFQVVDPGRLKVQAPTPLPSALMAEVREHKADILMLLAEEVSIDSPSPVVNEDTASLLAWASQAADAGLTLPAPVQFDEAPLRPRTTAEVGRFCRDQLKYLSLARSNRATGGWGRFTPQWWTELEASIITSLAAVKDAVDQNHTPGDEKHD